MKSFQNILILSLAAGVSLILSSCGPSGNQPNVELMQDMMETPAMRPQAYTDFFQDNHGTMRVPPDHTIPVGFKPYKYGYEFDRASKENKNPLAGDFSKEVMMVGQKYFETNCMVCHGMKGLGDGLVAPKMPKTPPSLMTDKIKGWTDGGIYHVISMGQGTMGPYATHILQANRWQVVNYIRYLQKLDNESKK
jgi:mono/diheme cytochrome c family protein